LIYSGPLFAPITNDELRMTNGKNDEGFKRVSDCFVKSVARCLYYMAYFYEWRITNDECGRMTRTLKE